MTLLELLGLLRKHLKLLIALPILCAALAGVLAYLMEDEYTATTSMYVLLSEDAESSTSSTYTDLSASQMIANDVATLAESSRVAEDVAESLGLEDLDDFEVSVESSTSTRIITLSVTGTDPAQCATIANAYVQDVSNVAISVMDVESVNLIDSANAPTSPSGPNRPLYVAVAFLAGLFIAICIIVLADMVNTKVRREEDVTELIGVPVVGRFPQI